MKGCVYMDNIFKKSEWELEEALKSIEDKIVDVDYDPARRNVRALKCIKLVIRYLKKMDESAQTIPNAIRQFAFILRTGEFRYISQERPMENVFFEFLSPLEEATYQLMKDTVYAAKWLVCYSDVYEKEDEEKRKQVRKAFIGIILEERKWERKREEKKKQEELRRVLEEIECEEDDEEEEENEEEALYARLYQHLDKYVVGQEDVKKTITMAVYRYIKHGKRNPVLMIGPTGCGKNYLMEKLAEFEDVRNEMIVYTYDASGLTSAGYKGNDVMDIFTGFKKASHIKGKSCKKGIIYLDEIDKIVMPNTDGNGENTNAFVQHQLLSAIAGTAEISGVDTKNILFILGGAFGQLDELGKEKQTSFGFGTQESIWEKESDATLRENLVAYGAQKEFLGRINSIVRMRRLNQEELKKILLHEETGVLNLKKQEFAFDGLELEFQNEVVDLIAEKVYKENLGARSAVNIVETLLGNYDFEMLMNGDTKMIVHAGMLKGEEPFFEREEEKEKFELS